MKTVTSLLLLLPALAVAQPDSLSPQRSVLPPLSSIDSLKPVEFREIPYQYTTSSTQTYHGRTTHSYSTSTGIHRIYTYDGIDVEDPGKTLWPTLLATNDPDVIRLRGEYDGMVQRQQTAMGVGVGLMVPGFIMMIVGAAQNREYQQQVNQQKASSYTIMQPTTTYTTRTCSTWSGSPNSQGVTTWTCSSDPTWTYTGANPPFTQQIPVTTTVPVTRQATNPITVSDGKGLAIAGLASMLVGMIVFCSSRGDQSGTFLRAVQYYNRSLKQKVAWELLPCSTMGVAGPAVLIRF